MADVLPIAIPALAGLLALLLAPRLDRWQERFERWADARLRAAARAVGAWCASRRWLG